jgi:hypothetical protein
MAILDITNIVNRDDTDLTDMCKWLMENVGQLVRKGENISTVIYEDDKLVKHHITGIGWHMVVTSGRFMNQQFEVILNVYDDLIATQVRLTWQ